MELVKALKNALPISYTEEYKAKREQNKLVELPVHQISANPNQPRLKFDTSSIGELSESIKKYGVIQPITVRRLASDRYELIAGERRLRASIMAGLLKIPSIIVSLGDNDSAVVAGAQIGIAMGKGGSALTVEEADAVIMDDDLRKIPVAIRIARRTARIATQNIALSLGIKLAVLVIGVAVLAFTGQRIPMEIAMVADVGAAILTVSNALRASK